MKGEKKEKKNKKSLWYEATEGWWIFATPQIWKHFFEYRRNERENKNVDDDDDCDLGEMILQNAAAATFS